MVAIVDLRADGTVALADREDRIQPANAKAKRCEKDSESRARPFRCACLRLGENASMSKTKARIVTTDAEIDAAIAQAKVYDQYRSKAVAAAYRAKDDVIVIKLATGVELTIPRKLLQGLENTTPAQLAEVKVVVAQSGLHWESLDVDHYIPALIDGVFGTRTWMSELGKIGGTSRSEAQRAAARKNGRKGGRPRKPTAA
jgi:hypothetical protein